jgi:hypothetical protein
VFPVPRRAHGAIDQHRSSPDDLARIGNDSSEDVSDDRAQQVPAAADCGLADIEHRARDVLCDVLPHQEHHHRHRPEQPQREGTTTRDELARAHAMHTDHQIGELLISQSCHSLVPQQLLPDSFRCLPDNETRRQELLHFKHDTHPGIIR